MSCRAVGDSFPALAGQHKIFDDKVYPAVLEGDIMSP